MQVLPVAMNYGSMNKDKDKAGGALYLAPGRVVSSLGLAATPRLRQRSSH